MGTIALSRSPAGGKNSKMLAAMISAKLLFFFFFAFMKTVHFQKAYAVKIRAQDYLEQ